MQESRKTGHHYEQLALHWLQQQGLTSVEQNFNCRLGEIDLIMLDNQTLCFIEVKYRKNNAFGGTAFSIPASKQHKITRSALTFIAMHKIWQQHTYRFDALFIQSGTAASAHNFEWIKNAFEAAPTASC
jgi:putative endonuclease